jgi:hypothetical protein
MFGAFITEGYLRHRPLRRKGPTTCKGRQRTMLQGIHFRNGLLAMLMAQTVVATDPPRRGGTAPDTISAIVFYGDEKLLDPETAMSDEQIADLLDSLCTLDPAPEDMIRDLRLFQRIRSMDEVAIVQLIDSLFELETVPYALINEINLYASEMPT